MTHCPSEYADESTSYLDMESGVLLPESHDPTILEVKVNWGHVAMERKGQDKMYWQ